MSVREAPLFRHQLEFVLDETSDILALSGGYRSGKTGAAVAKCCHLGARNWPSIGLIVEPTYRMIHDVFLPTAELLLTKWGVPFSWAKGDAVLTIGAGTAMPIEVWCRSGDDPRRLKGITAGWGLIDEFEIQDEQVGTEMLARISDPRAPVQQLGLLGTPEGYGWGYRWLEEEPSPGTRIIRARTTDNTIVGAKYAERLGAKLSDSERAMYLDGIRTKRAGRVYGRFERSIHVTPCRDIRGDHEMWCDFNVRKMVWLFSTIRADRAHVWGEIVREDTDTMAQADEAAALLADAYSKAYGRRFTPIEAARMTTVICDAAGNSASTSSKQSDVAILISRGFKVKHLASNPFVEDRVLALNVALQEERLHVDPKAPVLIRCLEQQGYASDGKPEKAKNAKEGLDHANDACGYGVFFRWPAWKPRGNDVTPRRGQRTAGGLWAA